MNVQNRKLDEEQMFRSAQEGFAVWPTGKDVDLKKAVEYQKTIPKSRIAALKFRRAKELGATLVQPRGGTVPIENQIALQQHLEKAGADFVSVINDNYSRTRRLKDAERVLAESIKTGRPLLNGFPVIIYGVEPCKTVFASVDVPVRSALCLEGDWRIDTGIYLTSGSNYLVAGAIGHTIPYEKNVPLLPAIRNMQVVDRMCGYMEEHGVPIAREYHMTLTGTLVPQSIAISILIIEGLMAAEQGVKTIVQQFALCGCMVQDVAALRVLSKLSDQYLKRFGYTDVVQVTGCSQWMGDFPLDEDKAMGVIAYGTTTAVLGGATMVMCKSPQEAFGIPTKEASASGIKISKQIVGMMGNQRMPMSAELTTEMELIEREVRALLTRVLDLGNGDAAVGIIRAFETGVVDVPFSPSIHNAGKVIPVKDANGAIRILEAGNLPFDSEILDFHREKIADRGRKENRAIGFNVVSEDITSVSKPKFRNLA